MILVLTEVEVCLVRMAQDPDGCEGGVGVVLAITADETALVIGAVVLDNCQLLPGYEMETLCPSLRNVVV